MYYGNYNEIGDYIGFYSDEIHTFIPEPNILLTTEEWQLALTGDYKVIDGINTYVNNPIDPNYELNQIRGIRNQLLINSDWTQLIDSPLPDEKKEQWKVYRQALRDMTSQENTHVIVYPTEP